MKNFRLSSPLKRFFKFIFKIYIYKFFDIPFFSFFSYLELIKFKIDQYVFQDYKLICFIKKTIIRQRNNFLFAPPRDCLSSEERHDDFVPALIDGANSRPLCDYRAIRRPITYKRHRRNREITVRRGSLAVSILSDVKSTSLPNKT